MERSRWEADDIDGKTEGSRERGATESICGDENIRVVRGPQTLPPACSFACHAVASRGGGSVKPKKS